MKRRAWRKRIGLTALLFAIIAALWWSRLPAITVEQPSPVVEVNRRPLRLEAPVLIPPRLEIADTAVPLPVVQLDVFYGKPSGMSPDMDGKLSYAELWPTPDEAPWPHEETAHAISCVLCSLEQAWGGDSDLCSPWCGETTDDFDAAENLLAVAEEEDVFSAGPGAPPWAQAQAAFVSMVTTMNDGPVGVTADGSTISDFSDAVERAEAIIANHPGHPASRMARSLSIFLTSDGSDLGTAPDVARDHIATVLRNESDSPERQLAIVGFAGTLDDLTSDVPQSAPLSNEWFELIADLPPAQRGHLSASAALATLKHDPAQSHQWLKWADEALALDTGERDLDLDALRGRLSEAGYGAPPTWRTSLAAELWYCVRDTDVKTHLPSLEAFWSGTNWSDVVSRSKSEPTAELHQCITRALQTATPPNPLELRVSFSRY